MNNYPDHPVLESAGTYSLLEFYYHGFSWTPDDHYIELTLQKGPDVVHLRFSRPRQLTINEYFPTQRGLFISNISRDGLEDVAVKVGDCENSSIQFYAKSVVRL